MKTVKHVCAWCKDELREPTLYYSEVYETVVSHGICKECLKKEFSNLNKSAA